MHAEAPLPASETLTDEELEAITGYKIPSKQREWLTRNDWVHRLSRANRPVVGRIYARMMLAGVKPASTKASPAQEAWSLDLSKVG
jgi:hypothetical protein